MALYPKQVRIENSGLKISPLVVGCMSIGSREFDLWAVEDKREVFKLLKYCYDRGLRTFDTADAYSNGVSEQLLGEFLKHYEIERETVVILSKVLFPVRKGLTQSKKLRETRQRGFVKYDKLKRSF